MAMANGIECVQMLYLYKSPGIRSEQLFDLGVLGEDLTAPRGVRLVRVGPKEIGGHYPVFSILFLHFHNHCFLRGVRSFPGAVEAWKRKSASESQALVMCLWIQSVFVLDL